MKLTVLCLFAVLTVGAQMAGAQSTEDLQGFTHNGWWGTYIIRLPGVEQVSQWFLVLPLSQNAIKVK
jgi:hypothetical protein